jgi:hypothetical protein
MSVGDLVEVTLHVARVTAAHHVPAAAVKRVERDDAVFVVVDGRVELRRVRTGITTLDGRTEILAGLESGDAVAVHSTRRLEGGSRVKVVPAIVAQRP